MIDVERLNIFTDVERLNIFGFVHPTGRGASFLMPVFGDDKNLQIQKIGHNGVITDFSPCYLPESVIIRKSSGQYRRVGDPALFAFCFEDETIIADTRNNLKRVIEKKIDEFNDLPFLKLEVLIFLNKKKELPQTIYAAIDKLRSLNPKVVEKWKEKIEQQISEPKIDIDRLQRLAVRHLIGRINEREQLYESLERSDIGVVGIIADGGVGKSALVYDWLNRLEVQKYDISHIFAWSFNDRGKEHITTSSSDFYLNVLKFFDIDVEKNISEYEKPRLLFDNFKRNYAILVIDGIESLQYPIDINRGKFFDSAIRSFLLNAVQSQIDKQNRLIVITSREPLRDLEGIHGYKPIELNYLNKTDGAKLLSLLGVQGIQSELEKASYENNGHCLDLVLLGKLICGWFKGSNISNRREIYNLTKHVTYLPEDEPYWRHAKRIMKYYKTIISDEKDKILLQMMALFLHRPMLDEQRLYLLERADFTKPVSKLDEREWNLVYRKLEQYGLLLKDQDEEITMRRVKWDCHPLVREYFRQTFDLPAWKQAHKVLFEYFQEVPYEERPFTLLDIMPLYRAVHHGCLAGMYDDALELYKSRIMRDEMQAYSTNLLGATAEDVAALGRFFEKNHETQESGDTILPARERSWLRARVAFCYTCLGRLNEAITKRKEELALNSRETHEDKINAASTLGYISELHVFLGNLQLAKEKAENAIDDADRCGDWGQKMKSRCRLAIVYRLKGNLKESLNLFQEAERIQHKGEPRKPRLYSDHGFWHRLLLLDMADNRIEYERIYAYSRQALDEDDRDAETPWRLTFGLELLIHACALSELNDEKQAENAFNKAYEELKSSGNILYLPELFLAKAKFNRKYKSIEEALNDTEEALRIAKLYGMPLYQADAMLVMAQLYLDRQQIEEASNYLEEAKHLIGDYTYSLRIPEKEMLEAQLFFLNGDIHETRRLLDDAHRLIVDRGYNNLLSRWKELDKSITIERFNTLIESSCKFVKRQEGIWDHTSWLKFLSELQQEGFTLSDDMKKNYIGSVLESMKKVYNASTATESMQNYMANISEHAVNFIKKTEGTWNHTSWLNFLSNLQQEGFELSDETRSSIGEALESVNNFYNSLLGLK